MPKVTFLKNYRPKGDDPAIPAYKSGESYDLEVSYAEKYKRLGLAVDAVAPKSVRGKAAAPESPVVTLQDRKPADAARAFGGYFDKASETT